MNQTAHLTSLIAVVSGLIIASLLAKSACRRIAVPALAGYLILGAGVAALNARWQFIDGQGVATIDFLGQLGLIALLVRVGLDSDLKVLLAQLRKASPIWIVSIIVSAALGFVATRYLLGYGVLPSVVVAVAMTATSVGVPSAVWEKERAIETETGQLFVDVAELDDISGIMLMALLFSVLPALKHSGDAGQTLDLSQLPLADILRTLGLLVVKLGALAAGCFFFARFLERPLINALTRAEGRTDALISNLGVGACIAAIAAGLGFSVAVGGFFAGLAFSRRRKDLRGAAFDTIYDILVPFFFIAVGLSLEPSSAFTAVWATGVLFAAAAIGKYIGTVGPALPMLGFGGASLLGLSMMPRAEITMIIAGRGLEHGESVMPQKLHDALIVAALLTCLTAPIGIRLLIRRQLGDRDADTTAHQQD